MGDIIVLGILSLTVGAAIASLWKSRKKGGCCGSCTSCSGCAMAGACQKK